MLLSKARLPFDCAGHHATLHLFAEQQINNYGWHCSHHKSRPHGSPVCSIFPYHLHDTYRQRAVFFRIDKGDGKHHFIPRGQKCKNRNRSQCRPYQWKHNRKECPVNTAPIQKCRFFQFFGQCLEKTNHKENRHRQRKGNIGNDNGLISIQHFHIFQHNEYRQKHCMEGNHQSQ